MNIKKYTFAILSFSLSLISHSIYTNPELAVHVQTACKKQGPDHRKAYGLEYDKKSYLYFLVTPENDKIDLSSLIKEKYSGKINLKLPLIKTQQGLVPIQSANGNWVAILIEMPGWIITTEKCIFLDIKNNEINLPNNSENFPDSPTSAVLVNSAGEIITEYDHPIAVSYTQECVLTNLCEQSFTSFNDSSFIPFRQKILHNTFTTQKHVGLLYGITTACGRYMRIDQGAKPSQIYDLEGHKIIENEGIPFHHISGEIAVDHKKQPLFQKNNQNISKILNIECQPMLEIHSNLNYIYQVHFLPKTKEYILLQRYDNNNASTLKLTLYNQLDNTQEDILSCICKKSSAFKYLALENKNCKNNIFTLVCAGDNTNQIFIPVYNDNSSIKGSEKINEKDILFYNYDTKEIKILKSNNKEAFRKYIEAVWVVTQQSDSKVLYSPLDYVPLQSTPQYYKICENPSELFTITWKNGDLQEYQIQWMANTIESITKKKINFSKASKLYNTTIITQDTPNP